MRLIVALTSLMLGLATPLLLNGQTFTNSLFGIAFAGAAVALASGPARTPRAPGARPWAGRIVVGLGVLLAAALLAQLPSAYRSQGDFNPKAMQLRRRRHRAGGTVKVSVP